MPNMLFQSGVAAGIAVGAAFGSALFTAIVFLLLRRYEALVLAKKEAMMAPIVREKQGYTYWLRRHWLRNFGEEDLNTTSGTYNDDLTELYLRDYYGGLSGHNFNGRFSIGEDASPQFDPAAVNGIDPAPHDIPAALSRYFDGQLDLGLDPKIIKKLLFDRGYFERSDAIEFLFNKAALSFCNFGSNPKYSLLPPKILELNEEIRARGFKELDSFRDKGYSSTVPLQSLPSNEVRTKKSVDDEENRFTTLYMRWRVSTFKMYGKDTMTPEVQVLIDRRVDFLLTVLGPVLNPETLVEARAALQSKMLCSLQLALFCAGQPCLVTHSWDFIGPTTKVVYIGEPETIPLFDMMAEKTLIKRPAFLGMNSNFHGVPFVNAYIFDPAAVVKYTDKEWAELTDD